jgi:hypothetical protein
MPEIKHSRDRLAHELRTIGRLDMAVKAAEGYYDDFLSPLAAPAIVLAHELSVIGTPDALALRARVTEGEFDATAEEADAWAKSSEGRRAFRQLSVMNQIFERTQRKHS